MIRLDGNNLAAFRGAGVAGTVQSVAGCELFGAARWPSWANPYLPYSKAAGEALVAQFPTQWPTIRDYGFAHPALVPFINEDPMLVMSLIDGLGTRWLVGDGASLIDLGIKLGTGSKTLAAFKYIVNPVNNKSLLAGVNVQQIHYNQYLYYQYQGTWNSTGMSMAKDTEYEIETSLMQGSQYIKVNGVIKKTTTSGGTQEPTTNTCIFSYSPEGTGTEVTCKFAKAWLNGELVRDMVPFISQTQGMGMLDLVNGVFHENKGTGSFTISESPA